MTDALRDRVTPGIWIVEGWSKKESQVVAVHCGKRTLVCAGVMPADARVIAAAGNAANKTTPTGAA